MKRRLLPMKRVLIDDRAALYHGDCRRVIGRAVFAAGVDHFIMDPPYERDMHEAKKKRDRAIRTDGRAMPKALGFPSIDGMREWVADRCRGRGWFIAFCSPEGVAAWRDAAEAAGHRYKRACVWVKPDAAPQFNGQGPAMGAEMFVTTWTGEGYSRWNGGGGRNVFTHMTNPPGRDGLHETEKPIALMMEIIEKFTNPGDTVCDPFMGTGATGCAALRLGRRFIGVERDRRFFDRAVDRCHAAAAQADMFIPREKLRQTIFDGMPAMRRKKMERTDDGKTETATPKP